MTGLQSVSREGGQGRKKDSWNFNVELADASPFILQKFQEDGIEFMELTHSSSNVTQDIVVGRIKGIAHMYIEWATSWAIS